MREHFDFYGYNSPTAGIFYIGEVPYTYGEDYRNVKRYKEYQNVGFNILLLQHENSYEGEDFETSACNKCMTEAVKAGIDKIIVSDRRLKKLCIEENLLGEGGRFASQEEFYAYLDFCTAPYRNKAGFFGVQLFDEPKGSQLHSYGLVYRGLKTLFPDMYLQCNLFPMTGIDFLSVCATDSFSAYEEYLNTFAEESGTDSITFDEYPFLREYVLGVNSLRTYQIAAKVCKERGLELRAVMQTFSFFSRDHLIHRRVTERDVYWLMNLALGFGCKEFSFYTYFTKVNAVQIEGEKFDKEGCVPIHLTGYPVVDGIDGCSMVNRDGSRTRLYYAVKKIIGEFKAFEPIILDYKFHESYVAFEKGKTAEDFTQTKTAICNENCPISVQPSHGVVLINEMRKEGATMFMVENISNVKEELFEKRVMRVKIDLKAFADGAKFYFKGKEKALAVKDGVIRLQLHCGDALFIECQ